MKSLLLAKEATGGAIAREGFGYQDAFLLLNLPRWLSQGAFTCVISEVIGDIEVCYFTPSGERRIFIEAKDYALTVKPFWAEIQQFQTAFDGAGGLYTRFVYVAPALPGPLSPMFNKLERIRGVGAAFEEHSKPLTDAKQEFIEWVVKEGKESAALAEFILDHVDFVTFDATSADQQFAGEVLAALPCLDDVPANRCKALLPKWKELVQQSVKRGISRRDLEDALLDVLAENERANWLESPTQLTLIKGIPGEKLPPLCELTLDLRPYLGTGRGGLSAEDWQSLVTTADTISGFLQTSRKRKRIRLDSELRMSTAATLGMSLKAAKGHLLEILHRESVFPLYGVADDAKEPFFSVETVTGEGVEGVAVIQIGHATRADVQSVFTAFGLEGAHQVYLESSFAIVDNAQLHVAIREAKTALTNFRTSSQLKRIHLFIKGPSFFTMALGHRMNALGEIQLYDWVDNSYIATARLSI